MYNVIYDYAVEMKIKLFIDGYKKKNIDNFTDTGIFYENLIRENYIRNAKKFKEEIFEYIENILKEEKVIVYKPLENKKFIITIKVSNYLLFVEYSEDNIKKIRFVENISFNKK